MLCCGTYEGGGLFEFQTPSPSDPPNFSNPSFSKLRFWRKVLAPKAPKFFFWSPEGGFFFCPTCLYSRY